MRKRNCKPLLITLGVLMAIVIGGLIWVYYYLITPLSPQPGSGTGIVADNTRIDHFNLLLLGSDARPGQSGGNTDTIMLVQIDGNRMALLSIPRDTRVAIPGHGMQKINAAYSIGGPQLTARLIKELTGQEVENYAVVNWDGFIKMVDTVGGVTVDVPRNMTYDPGDGAKYRINLKKGVQHLNGQQALAFVRFRHEALGDIGRTSHQIEFMKALIAEASQPSTILKLPWLVPQLYRSVETNLSLGEMATLARAGKNMKNMKIVSQTLPGYFLDIDGISYWGVDPALARDVAFNLFTNGISTDKVVLNTPPGLEQPRPKPTPPQVTEPVKPSTPQVNNLGGPNPPSGNSGVNGSDNSGSGGNGSGGSGSVGNGSGSSGSVGNGSGSSGSGGNGSGSNGSGSGTSGSGSGSNSSTN